MNVAFLGLGGNMGDRLGNLRKSLTLLNETCGTIVKASSVYETDAWGSDSEKKYLNQVVQLETLLSAEELLERTLQAELRLGRLRTDKQNSDRTADIDILLFNSEIRDLKNLHLPHPRLHLRKFVLIPLCEIAPDLLHPVFKKTIHDLLQNCEDNLNVSAIG
jgi:2-amino-4-hydroxy-6-hydroxymethyldihydropteridine diphosphokinase